MKYEAQTSQLQLRFQCGRNPVHTSHYCFESRLWMTTQMPLCWVLGTESRPLNAYRISGILSMEIIIFRHHCHRVPMRLQHACAYQCLSLCTVSKKQTFLLSEIYTFSLICLRTLIQKEETLV